MLPGASIQGNVTISLPDVDIQDEDAIRKVVRDAGFEGLGWRIASVVNVKEWVDVRRGDPLANVPAPPIPGPTTTHIHMVRA